MKKLLLAGLIPIAAMAGLVASELLFRAASVRDLAGRLSGRGHLVAVVKGKGIYETDLGGAAETTARDITIVENLRRAAATEVIDPARVDRELSLLQTQFANDPAFAKALQASGLSYSALREEIAAHLRGRQWLEKRVGSAAPVTEEECRRFYQAHPNLFTQPVRFRASHLLLAAHDETPLEVVEEKELAIAELARRLTKGEPLAQLAAEASEDEANKNRGGDLGFFSEFRMAPDFMAEVRELPAGKVSKPFRTHLGFHIAQVTEIKPTRLRSFEEVYPEISLALANERRALQVENVARILGAAEYTRPNVH